MKHLKTKETYRQYLQSEHWKQLKGLVYETYGYRCFFHKRRTKYVELHHVNYRDWYDCTVKDLLPLCRECHENAHKDESWLRATKKALELHWKQLPNKSKERQVFAETDPEWLKEAKIKEIAIPSKPKARDRDRPNKSGRIYQVYSKVGKQITVLDEFRKLTTAQKKAKRLNKQAKKQEKVACFNFRLKTSIDG